MKNYAGRRGGQPQLIPANKSYLSANDQRAYQSSVGVFNWVNI